MKGRVIINTEFERGWLWCESSTKFIMKNIPELLTEIILRVDLVGTKPLQLVAYNSTLNEVNIS